MINRLKSSRFFYTLAASYSVLGVFLIAAQLVSGLTFDKWKFELAKAAQVAFIMPLELGLVDVAPLLFRSWYLAALLLVSVVLLISSGMNIRKGNLRALNVLTWLSGVNLVMRLILNFTLIPSSVFIQANEVVTTTNFLDPAVLITWANTGMLFSVTTLAYCLISKSQSVEAKARSPRK